MHIISLLIGSLGLCSIFVEFIDPRLLASADHSDNILISIFWLGFWIFIAWITWPESSEAAGSPLQTEQGYLIHRIKSGYPMTVNEGTLKKAMDTGDYLYEGRATYPMAGGFYFNNGYVPGGHIVVDDRTYEDERLN